MREAEHVRAHTIETTIAQLENHNKKSSQDDCVQSKGPSKDHTF